MFRLLFVTSLLALCQSAAFAQTTQPDDAATLYLQAAKLIDGLNADNIMSPSASDLNYHDYPPFPPDWQNMEQADFDANAPARALAHQARSIEQADWPQLNPQKMDVAYLNKCRNLSNELADAELYQHAQGDDAAAIETFRDQWHFADMVEHDEKFLVCFLVGIGIRAQSIDRLEVITSGVALTSDPLHTKDLQVSLAREIMADLLKHQDAKTQVDKFARAEVANGGKVNQDSIDRCTETARRVNAERDLAAMSIACHLCRFKTGKWPSSLDDLHAYLPSMPIDPWGDGKQMLGYMLVKKGLSDGSDRPLVYSRSGLKDGLFFRLDRPEYSYYVGDGSDLPGPEQKHGGQFRDVASWAPTEGVKISPTTQPLE